MLKIRRCPPARSRDRHGRLRSPVTEPDYRRGCAPPNKGKTYPPGVLRADQVLAMIDTMPTGKAGIRNRAMIALMWRTGVRVAEACALRPIDVELDTGRIHVLHGKGDQARTIGIDPGPTALIEEWLAVRADYTDMTAPLFCTITQPHTGEPLFTAYVRNMIKDSARRAGLDPALRVTPHTLRHTCAYELYEEGVRLDYIRRQLGHRSSATTWRYLEHLNPSEVIRAMRARDWPGSASRIARGA